MSQFAQAESTLLLDDPDDYLRLRDALARANFTTPGVLNVVGREGDSVPTDNHLLIRHAADGRPIDTLIRLLLVGLPMDAQLVREALAPLSLESLEKAGLLSFQDNMVSCPFKILPLHPFIIAFDRHQPGGSMAADFVMGVGSSTQNMIKLMIRRKAGLGLDLGTGCGILAFYGAAHADKMIAVDRNPRAVRLASFNARLNGISNIECREGDLFEPVRNLKFDHIISNAPFVITPSSGYLYLDGGLEGDQFCQRLVRGAAEHLNENGYCQFLCNWAHLKNRDWVERLGGWFLGAGCDVWVLQGETLEAGAYANTWIGHFEGKDSVHYSRLYNEWMDYYTREQIEAVSMGFITMRRKSGKQNWFHIDKEPDQKSGDLGDSIIRFFEARDYLAVIEKSDNANDANNPLLKVVLKVSPDLRLDVQCEQSEDTWRPLSHRLLLGSGLRFEAKTDGMACDLIARCNGRRTVGDVLENLAATSGISPDRVVAGGLQVVRHFIERGFLLPVELPESDSSGTV